MAIVRRKETFTDSIRSPLSYMQALKEEYIVRFVDKCIMYLVKDMICLKFLAVNSIVIPLRYI